MPEDWEERIRRAVHTTETRRSAFRSLVPLYIGAAIVVGAVTYGWGWLAGCDNVLDCDKWGTIDAGRMERLVNLDFF